MHAFMESKNESVVPQAKALVEQLAEVLSHATDDDRKNIGAWLDSNRGIEACARAKIDLRMSEFLLDLSTATVEDHLRFCEQNGRNLKKSKALNARLELVVKDAKEIKGPRSLNARLTATNGGTTTYKLYLRMARRIKWSTESGAPDYSEYDDWELRAPTQEERKLEWIRHLERHLPTKTDTALLELATWPLLTKGERGWSHSVPEWVRRQAAFARFESAVGHCIDASKTPFVNYALFVKAPLTPETYRVQLYIGLAKNHARDRWSVHLHHVSNLLRARGDVIALAALARKTQVVDACLALLAHQGELLTDACLMVISAHDSEADMVAAEAALRCDVILQVTNPCFGLNVK